MAKEKDTKKSRFFIFLVKLVGWLPFKLVYRTKYFYDEGSPRRWVKGRMMIISNHISSFDPAVVLQTFYFRNLHILAADHAYRNKPLTWCMDRMGCIKTDRNTIDLDSCKKIISVLERDKAVVVFPEGRIVPKNDIAEFKPGAVLMALKTNTPILPMYIGNKYGMLRRQAVMIGRPLNIHESIEYKKLSVRDMEDLAENIRQEVLYLKDKLEKKTKKRRRD